jgi:hypothetical protein
MYAVDEGTPMMLNECHVYERRAATIPEGIHDSQCRPDALPEATNTLGPPNVADGIVKPIYALCTEYAPVQDADKLPRDGMCKGGHAASITGGW